MKGLWAGWRDDATLMAGRLNSALAVAAALWYAYSVAAAAYLILSADTLKIVNGKRELVAKQQFSC